MALGPEHSLAGTDWTDLLGRLTSYAIFLYGADEVMPGTGVSPEDLAADVLLELAEGKIAFDRSRPLWPLLKKTLYHDFLDLRKSASHRTTVIADATGNEDGAMIAGLDALHAAETTPPDVLFRDKVYKAIGDDRELREFADAVLKHGASKVADIAFLIDATVEQVENRRKRLRRVLARVRLGLGA
jgi:hypothetical protein